MPRHFLTDFDFSADEIHKLFERTHWLKREQKARRPHRSLEGKTLGMVFEKSSTRTRVSFEVGMYQLGGHALNLTTQASQLGRGETYEDTARVLSRYVDGIMMRTFEQERIERLASASSVPVINGLSDLVHPCQILTDIFTVIEHQKDIRNQKVVYVGDGNNIAHSWIHAAMILEFELRIATPKGFEVHSSVLENVKKKNASHIFITNDPREAVRGATVINTDTWVSMGQEGAGEAEKKRVFQPYQVNVNLMALADKKAIVLHCLPAHRGEEITDDVMDGAQSRIFDQAENRLHVQKAILEKLMM
ncbi:MAG: ornithine carbamoyltransferase [Deltaproteobacteria bacterium]|nr:ornithine carbamoyltransferase [Deltaproteobacteria bacterium]